MKESFGESYILSEPVSLCTSFFQFTLTFHHEISIQNHRPNSVRSVSGQNKKTAFNLAASALVYFFLNYSPSR